VGSLYRTADACGCQEVFTCGITPHPNGSGADKLQKSALGAESLVPSRHFATTQQAVDCLREKFPDLKIIGMETTAKSEIYTQVDYDSYRISGVALVLGNEVTGVDTEILSSLDAIVEIPTFGAKNSLNVAACAPVVLYEILRQWKVE
jgi:23S rRNA (guanosine2251-2'-O)-methyltransferase